MEVRFNIELTEEIEGSVDVEGPLENEPDAAEDFVLRLLKEIYPDADHISVEIV